MERPLDADFLTETSQPRISDSAIVGTHVSENQGIVVIASKHGVTILDPLSYTTQIFDQPVPGTISDSLLISLADNSVALVLTSNLGIGAFQLTQEGLNLDSSIFLQSDPILSANPLSTSMGPGALLIFGKDGNVHTTRVNVDQGAISIENPTTVEVLEQTLRSRNATGSISLHVDRPGDTPLLLSLIHI